MATTADEHIDWCIDRAMMRLRNTRNKVIVVDGFLSDLEKHAGTLWLARHSAVPVLFLGNIHDPDKFREALESLKR